MIINERKKPSVPRAFYDGDYKRMEKSDFVPSGWRTYQESPYAEYKRRLGDATRFKCGNDQKDT